MAAPAYTNMSRVGPVSVMAGMGDAIWICAASDHQVLFPSSASGTMPSASTATTRWYMPTAAVSGITASSSTTRRVPPPTDPGAPASRICTSSSFPRIASDESQAAIDRSSTSTPSAPRFSIAIVIGSRLPGP